MKNKIILSIPSMVALATMSTIVVSCGPGQKLETMNLTSTHLKTTTVGQDTRTIIDMEMVKVDYPDSEKYGSFWFATEASTQITALTADFFNYFPNIKIIEENSFALKPVNLTELNTGDYVTEINNNIFSGSLLSSLVIGNSVTKIGERAFERNQLSSLVLGDSVTTIGNSAFLNNQLSSLVIPNSVTTIGPSAFQRNQLSSLVIGNSVTTIGDWAFQNNQLSSLVIPDSVTEIESNAFAGNQLSYLVIGNSVATIGKYAFSNNQLSSLIIPSSVTTIDESAFVSNMFDLQNLPIIPASVINQGINIFAGQLLPVYITSELLITVGNKVSVDMNKLKVKYSKIPEKYEEFYFDTQSSQQITALEGEFFNYFSGIKTISGYNASGGKSNNFAEKPVKLTELNTGDYVTIIGLGAFENNQLNSLIIGNSVTTIGDWAFQNNQLNSLVIPDSVTEIHSSAFRDNQLSSLVLGNSVTTIGDWTFAGNMFDPNNLPVIPSTVINQGTNIFANQKPAPQPAPTLIKKDEYL